MPENIELPRRAGQDSFRSSSGEQQRGLREGFRKQHSVERSSSDNESDKEFDRLRVRCRALLLKFSMSCSSIEDCKCRSVKRNKTGVAVIIKMVDIHQTVNRRMQL